MDSDDAKELTNKIRWAIGSTLDGGRDGGFNMSYREQMWLAGMLTSSISDVLGALKVARSSKTNGHIDRKLVQSLLTQVTIAD